jgi:hypothetical protein
MDRPASKGSLGLFFDGVVKKKTRPTGRVLLLICEPLTT